jgi:hypothetical protein
MLNKLSLTEEEKFHRLKSYWISLLAIVPMQKPLCFMQMAVMKVV